MSDTPHFAAGYQRPNLPDLTQRTRALAEACRAADGEATTLEVVRSWNRLRAEVDTNLNRAFVRYRQDTTDSAARAEQDFWDGATPTLRELDVLWARTLLASAHRDAIGRELGEQLLRLKECAAATFDPAIAGAIAEEAALSSEYTALVARKEATYRGESYTMAGLRGLWGDPDRQVRLEAHQARDRFMADHAADFDRIYDRLVALRHGMATTLGLESFTPLGYRLMTRIGYDDGDVARFRDAIHDVIVPLAADLAERQRQRLGVDALMLHDEAVLDPAGNPRPRGDAHAILETARTMYHELHPELGAFMDVMLDKGLLDVELRDGKAPGGFCTYFADLGLPFVFAQFTGTDDDLQVVTHECGHAFQCYASRELEAVEYAFPTYEAAEVHSMGMEFLTYPWMERFFGADADLYRRCHLQRALTCLPYLALVDHFQHRVYAEPTMSPAQRKAAWLELEAHYMPWRNYGDLFPHLATGTVWQRQSHIYQVPFYYIDYALAGVCALQIFLKAANDREGTLNDYLAMCKVGGSVSFAEMLEVGNLRSPFDPAVLADVANHARAVLDE